MNRTEIEIKLNQDRAWTLETWAGMPPDQATRAITASKHDPEASWSAKDHLSTQSAHIDKLKFVGRSRLRYE